MHDHHRHLELKPPVPADERLAAIVEMADRRSPDQSPTRRRRAAEPRPPGYRAIVSRMATAVTRTNAADNTAAKRTSAWSSDVLTEKGGSEGV